MTAFSLSAVVGLQWQSGVAFSADLFFAIIFSGQSSNSRLHGTASESQNQVKSAFLLDVVIAQGSAVLQLFSGKDQSLLI